MQNYTDSCYKESKRHAAFLNRALQNLKMIQTSPYIVVVGGELIKPEIKKNADFFWLEPYDAVYT